MKLSRQGRHWSWTPAEDEQLRAILAAGEGIASAAAKLNRTISSIINRASQLRLSTQIKWAVVKHNRLEFQIGDRVRLSKLGIDRRGRGGRTGQILKIYTSTTVVVQFDDRHTPVKLPATYLERDLD
jgi:hypothetical protein